MDHIAQVPVIDAQAYLEKTPGKWEEQCKLIAESFHKYGVAILKDPRVEENLNDDYINLMERYFESTARKYFELGISEDIHPEMNYQVGATPEKTEKARNHKAMLAYISEENKPRSTFPPDWDAKWRFFWPIGERDSEVSQRYPKVMPKDFPEWESTMDIWGSKLLDGASVAVEMAAIGMGLPARTFIDMMEGAPHLLGPTGSDLNKYGPGTTFAGFHYDLNFVTIHGKSRYPGLYIWLRDWTKAIVKVPTGCFLLQAGAMFEHITGGYVLNGYHEVIYTEDTQRVVDQVKEDNANGGNRSLWRVSSTLFAHLRHNVNLSPLPEMKALVADIDLRKYKQMTADEKLHEELRAINLSQANKA